MLIQRIFASVLLLVCVGLALMAWPYQAAFSYEPVGPRAFPLLMIGLLSLENGLILGAVALTLFALGPVMLLIYFITAFVAEAR